MASKQVQVQFGAQIGNLVAGVNQINAKFDEMGSRFRGLQNTLQAGLAGIAAAFSLNAIKSFAAAMGDLGNYLSDTGQALGLASADVLRLRNSLTIAGADAQTGMKGFTIFTKSIAEAGDASSHYAEAFRLIGVETRNADGSTKSFNDVLLATAEAFSKAPDGPNKTAIAMALFGKSGADLIPYLDAGREGVEQFLKSSDELAGALKDKTTASMLEMSQHSNNLKVAFQGVGTAIFESLAPAFNDVAGRIEKAVAWFNRSATQGGVVQKVLEILSGAVLYLGRAFDFMGAEIMTAVHVIENYVRSVVSSITTLTKVAGDVMKLDFSAAREHMREGADDMKRIWNEAGAQLIDDAKNVKDKFNAVWQGFFTPPDDAPHTGGALTGGKDFGSFGDDKQLAAEQKRQAARVKLAESAQAAINRIKDKADADAEAALEKETAKWKARFAPINQAFSQSVQGIIQGTTTLKQAWNSALQSMLLASAQHWTQVITNAIASQFALTTVTATGVATRKSIEDAGYTASLGKQIWAALKSIYIDAAKVFGDVFAWAAPALGPFAAIPAGIATAAVIGATALLPALDTGSWNIPSEMVALLHPGEMVVPRFESDLFKAQIAGRGDETISDRGGGQVVNTIHVAPTYHVNGGGNVMDQLKRHDRDLVRLINKTLRDNPSLKPT